jgi:hypothetical protein
VFGDENHNTIWFITDKNTFKLDPDINGNPTYFGGQITMTIDHYRPKDVYVNLNKMTPAQAILACSNNASDSSLSSFERGNTKDFFSGFYKLPSTLS